jgi:PDZ domain-containing secreted protein
MGKSDNFDYLRDYENKNGQKIDLTKATLKDVRMILLARIFLRMQKKTLWADGAIWLAVIFCFTLMFWNFRLSLEPKTYSVPGDYINASSFTNQSDEDSVGALSVRHLEVNSVLKQLYFWVEFRNEKEFIEEINPLDGILVSPDVVMGNDAYDMQMSAYLAVKKAAGVNTQYTEDVFVYSVPKPLGEPKLLPGDIIRKSDGKLITSDTEIKEMQLNPINRKLQVERGSSIIEIDSDLNGITVKRQMYLDNKGDYQDFYNYAKIDKPHYIGTSAGSALALEYYNTSVENVIKGRKVAATGSIESNGKVGSISSVKQKLLLAINNGMEIVFVPRDTEEDKNYTDALSVVKGMNSDISLVPVSTLSDMVNYLKGE